MRPVHRLGLRVLAATCVALPLLPATASVGSAAPGRVVPATAFGTHYLGVGAYPWPKVAFGTLRVWDDGFSWRDLQPAAGVWDEARLARLDQLVSTAHRRGTQVILTLGQTPRWASSNPDGDGGTDPRTRFFYGPGAGFAPSRAGLVAWSAYVTFLARRYRTQVSAFEVWNEANYPTYSQMTMPQMVSLARLARAAVRTAGSRAAILAPSVGARHPNAPGWVAGFLRAGGGRYVDAVSLHMYPAPGTGPEQMLRPLAAVRAAMARGHAARLPVWDTEVGYGLASAGRYYSGAAARGYVARTFLVELSSGIARTVWYGWGDRSYSGLYVMGPDGALNANGAVERTVYTWMVGAAATGCTHRGALWRCGFTYRNGSRAVALWSLTGAPVVRLPAGARRLQSSTGAVRGVRGGTPVRLGVDPVLVRF